MKLVLHSYWRSSSSYRVRIGLHLKHLPFAYVAVDIGAGQQHADAFRALNPMAQVPVLEVVEDEGARDRLVQSLPILAYLDERWPDAPLLPRELATRARARALAELVSSGIQPHQNHATMQKLAALGVDELAWVKDHVRDGLAAFARLVGAADAFCVGDAPTIADCCLIPQLVVARRLGLEVAPALLAIEARCLALPAFADAAPERQPDAPR